MQVGTEKEVAQVDKFAVVLVLNVDDTPSVLAAADLLAALPLLVDLFDREGKLDRLDPFLSEFGARFFGYALSAESLTLVEEPWRVPAEVEAAPAPAAAAAPAVADTTPAAGDGPASTPPTADGHSPGSDT